MIEFVLPVCGTCGVPVADQAVHTRFHQNLVSVVRTVIAPNATDEEWAAMQAEAAAYLIIEKAADDLKDELPEDLR